MKGMMYEYVEPEGIDPYLDSDDWSLEQKLDGVRVMAHVHEDRVEFRNNNDDVMTFAAAAQWFDRLREVLKDFPVCVLDGELIIGTGEYWVFDLPYLQGVCGPTHAMEARRMALEALFDIVGLTGEDVGLAADPAVGPVHLIPQFHTPGTKRWFWNRIWAGNHEGVVVKRNDGTYCPGRRVRHVLKVKITHTVDVIVVARDVGGKNARLALFKDGHLVEIGGCSMIGKPDAQPGQVVEVKYQHVSDDVARSLYCPTVLRIREDKAPEDCTWDQLDYAIANREVLQP